MSQHYTKTTFAWFKHILLHIFHSLCSLRNVLHSQKRKKVEYTWLNKQILFKYKNELTIFFVENVNKHCIHCTQFYEISLFFQCCTTFFWFQRSLSIFSVFFLRVFTLILLSLFLSSYSVLSDDLLASFHKLLSVCSYFIFYFCLSIKFVSSKSRVCIGSIVRMKGIRFESFVFLGEVFFLLLTFRFT